MREHDAATCPHCRWYREMDEATALEDADDQWRRDHGLTVYGAEDA